MIKQKKWVGWAGGIAMVVGMCYRENKKVVTTNYTYTHHTLPERLEGYTVLHLSDLHNTSFGKGQKQLINIIKKCQPDSIMITGDIIDCHRLCLEPVITLIEQAVRMAPVYYVSGNHETWSGTYPYLAKILTRMGVYVLHDEVIQLEEGMIQLIGLQDRLIPDTEERLFQLMRPLEDTGGLKMLLVHRPEYFEKYVEANLHLVLTGHAHGGQMRLPYIGGLYAPGQGILPRYTCGLYKKKDTTMLSNRGLGNSRFPLRLGNKPEVVIIKLSKGVTLK